MTATTINLPDVPQPRKGRYGDRSWRWYDDDEECLTIRDEPADYPNVAASLYASDVGLTPAQCREVAAVLLALADDAEAGAR
jgi:hypothetical protein